MAAFRLAISACFVWLTFVRLSQNLASAQQQHCRREENVLLAPTFLGPSSVRGVLTESWRNSSHLSPVLRQNRSRRQVSVPVCFMILLLSGDVEKEDVKEFAVISVTCGFMLVAAT